MPKDWAPRRKKWRLGFFFGTGAGLDGLTAYLNANEFDQPLKFYYICEGDDFDYLSPLMGCWFIAGDIANFQPIERYITGKTLIDRWSKQPGIQPRAYIVAKIRESRLMDFHPMCGETIEDSLFALSHIKEIYSGPQFQDSSLSCALS